MLTLLLACALGSEWSLADGLRPPTTPMLMERAAPPPPKPTPRVVSKRPKRLRLAAGFGLAGATLYASSWTARTAYNQRPSQGLYMATNGTTVGAGAATATAVGFLISGLINP